MDVSLVYLSVQGIRKAQSVNPRVYSSPSGGTWPLCCLSVDVHRAFFVTDSALGERARTQFAECFSAKS